MLLIKRKNQLNETTFGSSQCNSLEPKVMLAGSATDKPENSKTATPKPYPVTEFQNRDVGEFSINANPWGVIEFQKEGKEGFTVAKGQKGSKNDPVKKFSALAFFDSTFVKLEKYGPDIVGGKVQVVNDGLKSTDNRPLGFPAVYIGKVNDRADTSAWNFEGVSQKNLKSAEFRLSAENLKTNKDKDKFNVTMDVWLGGNTVEPDEYLMVQAHNTSSHAGGKKGTGTGVGQPAGKLIAEGVKVGGVKYAVWHGKNHQDKPVTTYVAERGLASKGVDMISGDLVDFIDDAKKRNYVDQSNDLNAVFGGSEVWSGADGLVVDFGITIKE